MEDTGRPVQAAEPGDSCGEFNSAELDCSEGHVRFSPDGLTERVIDVLLGEVDAAGVVGPGASSALLDGSAAERRRHRMERRAVVAVVRVLPVRVVGAGRDGWAA